MQRIYLIQARRHISVTLDAHPALFEVNIVLRSIFRTHKAKMLAFLYIFQYYSIIVSSYVWMQIYGYRMSLWAEHIGALQGCFKQPESLECVRQVKSLSEVNWRQYAADEVTEMKSHLLKYPLEVDRTGKVKPLPGCVTFPDVGGTVTGTFTLIQENLTI